MTIIVAVAAVAVVAWFAAGTIWNVRLGREAMRWMQGGLPLLGRRTTVRWLGSSVVEMVINDGEPPFASATVLVFLEPRDLPWWPLSRLRGRRDTLMVRGTLRRVPAVQFEAFDPLSWSGREALARVPREWPRRPGAIVVRHENAAALASAESLIAAAEHAGMKVWRLSLRRSGPHFQLHVRLPDRRQPAHGFFEAVRALAERGT